MAVFEKWNTVKRGKLDIITSSPLTTGTIRSFTVTHTQKGAASGSSNFIEVAKFTLKSNVLTGGWANAVYAQIDFQTSGYVWGLAGVVCAELNLPDSDVANHGEYSCFEAEIGAGASCELNNNPVHVFVVNVWGDGAGQVDDFGYLFALTGVASGAAHMWYDKGSGISLGTCGESVRVKTPAGDRYLALYDQAS